MTRSKITAIAALLSLALGGAAHGAAKRTSFDPAKHGFRFANTFQNDFVRELDVRTGGLCGGMVYTALDYYNARRPIPEQTHRPAVQTPLHDYIYDRQVKSLTENLDKWAELGFNIEGVRSSEFFRWGLQGTGGGRLQELRREVDAGRPVPLGLQEYGGGGPGNHQVLAIGYDLGRYQGDLKSYQEELKIFIYDPNRPGQVMTLVPDLRKEGYSYAESPQSLWRTYFVDLKYGAKSPPTMVAAAPPREDGLVRELLLEFRTGSDDLRGGNDNLDVTVNFEGAGPQVVENVNGGRRWTDNYNQTIVIRLRTPVAVEKIRSVVLTTTFGGGMGGDNWNLDGLVIDARGGGVQKRIYSAAARPLFRFTGDRKSFTATMP